MQISTEIVVTVLLTIIGSYVTIKVIIAKFEERLKILEKTVDLLLELNKITSESISGNQEDIAMVDLKLTHMEENCRKLEHRLDETNEILQDTIKENTRAINELKIIIVNLRITQERNKENVQVNI